MVKTTMKSERQDESKFRTAVTLAEDRECDLEGKGNSGASHVLSSPSSGIKDKCLFLLFFKLHIYKMFFAHTSVA